MVTKTVTINGSDPLSISNPLHFDLSSPVKTNRGSRVTFSETSDTIELDSLEIEAEFNEWNGSNDSLSHQMQETQLDRGDDTVTVVETNTESASNTPEPLQPLKPYTPNMAVIKLNGKSKVRFFAAPIQ